MATRRIFSAEARDRPAAVPAGSTPESDTRVHTGQVQRRDQVGEPDQRVVAGTVRRVTSRSCTFGEVRTGLGQR